MRLPLHITTLDQVRAASNAIPLLPAEPWQRPMPAFVADLSPAGDRAPLAVPFHTIKAERFQTTLRDQLLFGFHHLHAAIGAGQVFNGQNIVDATALLDYHIAHHPGAAFNIPRFHAESGTPAGRFSISYDGFDEQAVRTLDTPVFLGTPIEPENWGMWLLQGLPTAAAFVAQGQPGRLLCHSAHPWQRSLLDFIGVRPEKLVNQEAWVSYRIPEITLHQYSAMDLIPRAPDLTLFETIGERARRQTDPPRAPRLFVSRRTASRKPGAYRVLTNEDALLETLLPLGFTLVEPELLRFEDQVALFGQAEAVAGLGGAAMFNTVFCRPGTKIVSIESTPTFVHNHANVFAAMGHEYGFILGQDDPSGGRFPHNSWTVDPARTAQLVADFF